MDDFERVFSLLISDKLKSCLPAGALNYVLSLEGNDWFDPLRIGELADTYVSNHASIEKPKHVSGAYVASNGFSSPVVSHGLLWSPAVSCRLGGPRTSVCNQPHRYRNSHAICNHTEPPVFTPAKLRW